MTAFSANSSQGKLEKAMQALLVARRLQHDKLSLGADYVNIEIDVANTWLEPTDEQLEVNQVVNESVSNVNTALTSQPQQNSVAEVARWLENNPDSEAVRTQYLVLVESEGTIEQKLQAIEQTSNWLLSHPQAVTVREKYLSLINEAGTLQQQQQAVVQTWDWLQANRQNTFVREQYLVLLAKAGTRQQHQQALIETDAWLQSHPEDRYVRAQYLKLLGELGTRQQQQEMIAQTTMWLRAHPQDNYVREQYLTLVNQLDSSPQSAPVRGINLRKLQEVFDSIGEAIDNLLSPPEANLAFGAFRSASNATWKQLYTQELLFQGQAVLLQLESRPEDEGKISIRIQLQPTGSDLYLPEGLRLFLLSSLQDQLYEDEAESNRELIEVILPDGDSGESFTIEVTKGDTSFIEEFIV
jgi:Protein of unknown function (DUF1822)